MRPLRNTMLSSIVTGSRVVAVALAMLLLARALGPTEFGALTYVLTVAVVVAVIPDYGFDLHIVRRVAAAPQEAFAIWRTAIRAKGILVVVALGCVLAWFAFQRAHVGDLSVSIILVLSALALSYGRLNTFIFRGIDRFDLDALTAVLMNGLLLVGVLAVVAMGAGVFAASLVFLVARGAYLAVTAWLLLKTTAGTPHTPVVSGATAALLREGFTFGVHTAVAVMYVSTDTLVLQHYAGSTAVGFYQAGMRLVMAAMFAPEVLTSGLFPSFAAAATSGRAPEAVALGKTMNRLMVMGGGVLAAGFALLPTPIRSVVFASQYAALDPLLPWFGLVILLRFVSSTYGAMATAAGGQTSRTIVGIVALAVNVAVNLMLIPRLGIGGAMAASVTTHALLLLGYAVLCHRLVGSWLLDGRSVVAGAAMLFVTGVALFALQGRPGPWGAVATMVVGAIALGVGTTRKEWQRMIAGLAPRPAIEEEQV